MATQVSQGLAKAIEELQSSADYANCSSRDGVPYWGGASRPRPKAWVFCY